MLSTIIIRYIFLIGIIKNINQIDNIVEMV